MILDRDLEIISQWPLCHPGETSILPDGTVIVLQNIVIPFCNMGKRALQYEPLDKLESAFRNTPCSWPVQHSRMMLSNPVLVMVADNGEWIGLDGKARVEFARKLHQSALPVIFIDEKQVREFATFNFEYLLEGETNASDKANYRAAMLASALHATMVPSRPWMLDPMRKSEQAFGAGTRDGQRLGRPYINIRVGADIGRDGEAAGRKANQDIEALEAGMGRILTHLRARLGQKGDAVSLPTIVEELSAGRILDSRGTYPLVLGLPHTRDLENLVAKSSGNPVAGGLFQSALQIRNLDARYDDPEIARLILFLRDLGAMRLRVQDYETARNALLRDAKRGAMLDPENYDRMLFDRSKRPEFQPVPHHFSIPGLIDTLAVARETGVLVSEYHADYYYTRPMHEAAAIKGAFDRGEDPMIELSTAISYLQHCFQLQCDAPGCAAHWWELSMGQDRVFENYLKFAALAAVRRQSAMPLSAARAEIERAMAA